MWHMLGDAPPFIGVAPQLEGGGALVECLERWAEEYGKDEGAYELTLMGRRWVVVCCEHGLREVVAMRPFKATRTKLTQRMQEVIPGIFNAEGDNWKKDRRIVAPAFNSKNMEGYFPYVQEVVSTALSKVQIGQSQNMTRLTQCMAAEVIATVAFGKGFGAFHGHAEELKLVDQIMAAAMSRIFAPIAWWKVPILGMLESAPRVKRRLADALGKCMADNDRMQRKDTLLTKLRETEESDKMTHEQLIGNIITLFVAGTDTTNLGTTWALHLLAQHAEIQDEVAAQIAALAPSGIGCEQDLQKLPLVQAVWAEALRLHSPATNLGVTTLVPMTLLGRELAPGTTVMLPTRYLQNHAPEAKALGSDLEAFRPSRWLSGGKMIPEAVALQAYPFGFGARACVGRKLADLEGPLFLAEFLRRFQVSGADTGVKERSSFTLGPDRDILLEVQPRKAA